MPLIVRANRELQRRDGERPSERSTRHLEIALPAGATYGAGDHLGVLPRNGVELIRRVLRHFKLDAGIYVTITPASRTCSTHLPVDEPVPLIGVLASCVELQDVATRSELEAMAAPHRATRSSATGCWRWPGTTPRAARATASGSSARASRSSTCSRRSRPAQLPFDAFLEMLPPLRPALLLDLLVAAGRPRTSAASPSACVEAPARCGHGHFHGRLLQLPGPQPADSTVFAFVRKPTIPFRPPANPHVPMIMVGPGTGLAPFRGFLQERAALKEQGVPVGESLLFFGCRDPRPGLPLRGGAASVRGSWASRAAPGLLARAGHSRRPTSSTRSREHGDEVWRLLQQEAVIFVCGDATRMAPDVRRAFADMFQPAHRHIGRPTPRPGSPACARRTATWRTSGARTDQAALLRRRSRMDASGREDDGVGRGRDLACDLLLRQRILLDLGFHSTRSVRMAKTERAGSG